MSDSSRTVAEATAGRLHVPVSAAPAGRDWRAIVLTSLAITALMATLAVPIHVASGERYLFVFVLLRWLAVLALLSTAVLARRTDLSLPGVARSPFTALFLTVESVLVDVIVAQTH